MSLNGIITFVQFLVVVLALFCMDALSTAQLVPASPPSADPADGRFAGVTEDYTSPSLTKTHLKPVQPLVAYNSDDHPGYTVELLQVQWRWADPLDLYVIKPKGVKRPPVILYLYGYPNDTETFQNESFQEAVTRNGFAAVGFVSALTGHRYRGRPMREWFVSELQESLSTSAHDVPMVLDYLATRGDLDMDRVGMFTQGSGASIGILASASEPRIKVLDALDPWGDWPTWMTKSSVVPEEERTPLTKPEFLKKVSILDPVEWVSKLEARKFRLQQSAFDEETPGAAQDKIRAAVPAGASVVVYKTLQEFIAAFRGGKNIEWMQLELMSLPAPQTANSAAAGSSDVAHSN